MRVASVLVPRSGDKNSLRSRERLGPPWAEVVHLAGYPLLAAGPVVVIRRIDRDHGWTSLAAVLARLLLTRSRNTAAFRQLAGAVLLQLGADVAYYGGFSIGSAVLAFLVLVRVAGLVRSGAHGYATAEPSST